jgi:TatD DNase family protein
MIDSHCHLDFSVFDEDRKKIVSDAKQLGVSQFVVPGVEASQWQKLMDISEQYPEFNFALGIHPYFLKSYKPQHLQDLRHQLENSSAIAVGECGIDGSLPDLPLQQSIFQAHVEIANDFNKPLIVHHRKSHHLILQTFANIKPQCGGVIHAFSGSKQDALKYIELGFKLGIGGTITYPRANKTRIAVSDLPLESLVLETDSPDMPINGYQGQRNEPKRLMKVAESLAQLKNTSVDNVAEQTQLNTIEVFNL